jgi:molecular chaperone HtpG
MTSRGQYQLHLPGLLKVLAEHLYSTQRVGVRELLQNAHDSCVRRACELPETGYRPRIDLTIDTPARILRIADNGSGLTEEEIHNYLTVIGRGYTRELRERLAITDSDTSVRLVGQFGIGFLAAYLLASEVTVETKSTNHRAIRWRSVGDQEFELSEGYREDIGTTIELRLKPSAFYLLREPSLIEAVREYADFLSTVIHVENSVAPVNLGMPPWNQVESESACRNYAKRRFGENDPLWVLPLTDGKVDLGHDTITIPLRGFLFVPAQSTVSVKEYGTLAVFIRHMAICNAEKDLLPSWARFVSGVIDSPALQPTASREAVHQDDAFEALRRVIADQLGNGLRQLAARDGETWRRIIYGHTDLIMGWAAKNHDFFRMVSMSIPLKTSRGRIPLPEYLQQSGNTLYYTTRQLGSLQDKILAEGRDVPAIDASWFGVQEFLTRFTEIHDDIQLVQLDDNLDTLLVRCPSNEFDELLRLGEELGFTTCAASFRPADFPAVMTYPADAETIRDAQSAMKEGLIPEAFSSLLESFIYQRQPHTRDGGTLHLNTTCPLIQRLASENIPIDRKQAALATIAFFAKLFCGRMLNATQASSDLKAWSRSLERLI